MSDALRQPLTFADTELSEGIQRHWLVGLLRAALSRTRRTDGEPLPNVLCALLGTSCYFDHTEGLHRKGHQVLQLGLAAEKGFVPLEAQIVTGQKGTVDKPKDKPFHDQRSSAARDMRRAREHSKHQLFRDMLQRALRAGFTASYVLADAWFGCKENIGCCLDNN